MIAGYELMENITLEELEDVFSQAARIERMLPDHDRVRLQARCGWPEYIYDADDRKDQEPECLKLRLTAQQISLLDKTAAWLLYLGARRTHRIITGKKIIWSRANGFSFQKIAAIAGLPPSTCKGWYKSDMQRILQRINSWK